VDDVDQVGGGDHGGFVDFLRREVEVRRQVKWLSGRGLVFAPPKRGKTRTVPLPEVVAVALAEHIRRFPSVEVPLPWTGKGGGEVTVPLVFTNTAGGPLNRGSWCSTCRWGMGPA
jgi:integrase